MSGTGKGFTLTELIVAVSLSALILVGIMGISAQMVRFQLQGSRKGDVTGWTLLGLQRMNKELENANVLDCPTNDGSSVTCVAPRNPSDRLAGCINYTRQSVPPGPLAANQRTLAFYYCIPVVGQYAYQLLRYELESGPGTGLPATCPLTPIPVACGNAPSAPMTMEVVVKGFYPSDGQTPFPFFERADDVSGVRLRYTVGLATPTAEISPTAAGPVPTYMRFDMKIGMNKSYTNTVD